MSTNVNKMLLLLIFLFMFTYEASESFAGSTIEISDIRVNGKNLTLNRLPIEQIENHLGKQSYFEHEKIIMPKKFGTKLNSTELRKWLSKAHITFGIDANETLYEEWIFPSGNLIYFTPDGAVSRGKISQLESLLCYQYGDAQTKWCFELYSTGNGFYLKQDDYQQSKFWTYFQSSVFTPSIDAEEFYQALLLPNAEAIFTAQSLVSSYTKSTFSGPIKQPNDIAIIIGNNDYKPQNSSIPNVEPAENDAKAIYNYLINTKGLSPDNIIRLNNATQSQMVNAFGSYRNHKGSAYNWVKAGKSNLYVYYAGHGAPSEDGGLLIPTDAKYDSVELNGYPVSQLLNNLSKIPAKSITVMLESCFSGVSAGGTVVANASPIYIQKSISSVPENINLITAAGPNQIASWQKDKRQSLFTKYLLMGLKGQADSAEYGNEDGKVDQQELQRYLDDTMTYDARRGYGREQSAKVQFTNGFVF